MPSTDMASPAAVDLCDNILEKSVDKLALDKSAERERGKIGDEEKEMLENEERDKLGDLETLVSPQSAEAPSSTFDEVLIFFIQVVKYLI